MLGRNYRFSVNNQSTVNVEVIITARRWKFVSGVRTWESSEATLFSESGIASSTSAWTEDTALDNSSDAYDGADLSILITPAASATGPVQVQVQRSTDGGTTWPGDGLGEPVLSHTFVASSTAVRLSTEL